MHRHFLDITHDVCPLTFVRTKIVIERLASGEILEIRLKGDEARTNVPRGLLELGHQIIEIVAEDSEPPEEIHRMIVRKR